MTIYKYNIFNRLSRKVYNLKESEDSIKNVYDEYIPNAEVTVNNDSYYVLNQEALTKGEAVAIGRRMSSNPCLSKYCDSTTKNHRLFRRYEWMEIDDFLLKYLCDLYKQYKDSKEEITRYIVKYRFYKKEHRTHFNLLEIGIENTIRAIYATYRPDARVEVFPEFYTVITEAPLLRMEAVAIGKEMSSDKELSQYRDFTTKNRRLFAWYERMEVDMSILKKIYYYHDEHNGGC